MACDVIIFPSIVFVCLKIFRIFVLLLRLYAYILHIHFFFLLNILFVKIVTPGRSHVTEMKCIQYPRLGT